MLADNKIFIPAAARSFQCDHESPAFSGWQPKWVRVLKKQIFGLAIGVVVAGLAQALFKCRSPARGNRINGLRPGTIQRCRSDAENGAGFDWCGRVQIRAARKVSLSGRSQHRCAVQLCVRCWVAQGMFGISLRRFIATLSGLAAEEVSGIPPTLSQGLSYLSFRKFDRPRYGASIGCADVRLISSAAGLVLTQRCM